MATRLKSLSDFMENISFNNLLNISVRNCKAVG
jgi:hypothetical protein